MPIIGGSRLVSARTAVDLPVPLRPQMRTPPINGSIALRIRASCIFCCSTIALNGNEVIFLPSRDAGYIYSLVLPDSGMLHVTTWPGLLSKARPIGSDNRHRQVRHSPSGDEPRQMPAIIRLR